MNTYPSLPSMSVSFVNVRGNMSGLNTRDIFCFLLYICRLAHALSARNEPLQVRLSDGTGHHDGRVEVFYGGEWGPVCDVNWTVHDANVVCRTLGYTYSIPNITENEYFEGRGSGDSEPDNDFTHNLNLRCNGTETNIAFCHYTSSTFPSCTWDKGVSVACEGIENIRLKTDTTTSDREGRVEVFYRGSWGTVCEHNFDINEAHVVCRMLGFAFSERYYVGEPHGEGTGDIHVDDLECTGSEVNIGQCSPTVTGTHNCTHARDVGVTCVALPLRLVNGSSPNEGRVEVYFEGSWGTICDDDWDIKSGNVVCRMLGYPGVGLSYGSSFFGRGSGPIVLDSTRCNGWESHIAHCRHAGYGNHNCDHTEDSGVVCSGEATAEVRLRDGPDPSQGRLEMYLFGAWGTVCRRNWTSVASAVVCRKLGYFGAADTLSIPSSYVPGAGMVLVREPRCQGKESDLLQCDLAYPLGVTDCTHEEDVWVSCLKKDELKVRLVGGSSENEGRVEVLHQGKWGTICDDNWNMLDSNVVCKMLGFDAAEDYSCCARFDKGSGDILLDEVQCNGREENIGHCMRQDYGVHDCDHSEDVGVSCITYELAVSSSPIVNEGPRKGVGALLSTGIAVVFFLLFLISLACLAYARSRVQHYRETAARAKRDLHLQPLSRKGECSNSYAKSFTGVSCRKHTDPRPELPAGDATCRRTAEPRPELPARDATCRRTAEPRPELPARDATCHGTTEPRPELPARDATCRRTTEPRPELPARDATCRRTTEPSTAATKGHPMGSKPAAPATECTGTQVQMVHPVATRPESPYEHQAYESPLEIYEVPDDYEDVMVATCKINI